MSLVFKHLLNTQQARSYREYRVALDGRLEAFESPFDPPYSHDLAHEQRLSPLVMWNAYYSGRANNLLTRGMCLASWCVLPGAIPEEVAWDVLLQVSRQTGTELWKTDIPGLDPCIRSAFACRNYSLESVCQPGRGGDDFHHDF